MKYFLAVLFIFPNIALANIKTHMVMEGSHLCIKSYSRSKCSLDAFTVKQSQPILKKIELVSKKIPDSIINNTLNHFWANHHTFNASELLNVFENINSTQCDLESSQHEQKKSIIAQKIKQLENQNLISEKTLVQACMNRKTASGVYPFLKSSPTKKIQ